MKLRYCFIIVTIFVLTSFAMAQYSWHEIQPQQAPTDRASFSMIYDSVNQNGVLFGGFGPSGMLNDTWVFQNNDWNRLFIPGPDKRYNHSFTWSNWDEAGYVIGGLTDNGSTGDMWRFKNGSWELVIPTAVPQRHSHAAVFDSGNNILYVYGGLDKNNAVINDLYAYDGQVFSPVTRINEDNEEEMNTAGALYGHSIVYDEANDRLVLFGGADENNVKQNTTFVFKDMEWNQLLTSASPSPRVYHHMVYDPVSKNILLFGGFDEGGRRNDLWMFDGQNWIPLKTSSGPSRRTRGGMIYEEKSRTTFLFGGINQNNQYLSDTWSLFKQSINFDRLNYRGIHDSAFITVHDYSANLHPGDVDNLHVLITSDTDPVGISLPLRETGDSTGIFSSDINGSTLGFTIRESNQEKKLISVKNGDTVTATYKDPRQNEITATATWSGSEKSVSLDREYYIGYKDEAFVTVVDKDANEDPDVRETVGVTISSETEGSSFDVTLTETGEDTGVFGFTKTQGAMVFDPAFSIGDQLRLKVSDNDTLSVIYHNYQLVELASDQAVWNRVFSEIVTEQDVYRGVFQGIDLELRDKDLNFTPNAADFTSVQVFSTSDPVGYEMWMVETGEQTGVFKPFQPIGFSIEDEETDPDQNKIKVQDGDLVTIKHTKFLDEPVYKTVMWKVFDENHSRPRLYIVLGPEDDEVTSASEVTFHYAAVGGEMKGLPAEDAEYQTKLMGMEEDWNKWVQSTKTTYKDLPSGKYTFWVQARNLEKLRSLPVSRTFYIQRGDDEPLVEPKMTVEPQSDRIKINWTHDFTGDVVGYFIYRKERNGEEIRLNKYILDPAMRQYIDDPVIPNTQYQYYVQVLDDEGKLVNSNKVWSAAPEGESTDDVLRFSNGIINLGNHLNKFTFTITNPDQTTPINWSLYSSDAALEITPASGTTLGGTTEVTIRLDRQDFDGGLHEISINVLSNTSSYLPESVDAGNSVMVRFGIPGPLAHISHSNYITYRIEERFRPVFVDMSTLNLPQWWYLWDSENRMPNQRIMVRAQASLYTISVPGFEDPFFALTPLDSNDKEWKVPYIYRIPGDPVGIVDLDPPGLINGDHNGQIDAGERVGIQVTFRNIGIVQARSLSMVLYCPDKLIEIPENPYVLNNVAEDVVTGSNGYFRVSENIPSMKGGYPFTIYCLLLDSDGYHWTSSFTLRAANISIKTKANIDDDNEGESTGNNNGVIEADEYIEMPVVLENTGKIDIPYVIQSIDEVSSPPLIAMKEQDPDTGEVSYVSTIARKAIQTDYSLPADSSLNVATDFELNVPSGYSGQEIQLASSMEFLNPVILDEYSMNPNTSLVYLGYAIADPNDDSEEPVKHPVFGFPYRYTFMQNINFNTHYVQDAEDIDLTEWEQGGQAGSFDPPTFGISDSSIALTSANNTNCFGFWNSPDPLAPLVTENLYRARFTVHTDQEDPTMVPTFRLRISDDNDQQVDAMVVSSKRDAEFLPGTDPREYEFFFMPNQYNGVDLKVAFDLINLSGQDAANATIYLDELVLERRPLDRIIPPQTIRTYDFEEDLQGWEFVTIPDVFTEAIQDYVDGTLWIKGVDDNTVGFWVSPADDIQISENMFLYNAKFTVRNDFETSQKDMPTIRFRLNATNNQLAILKSIDSKGGAEASPGYESKTYDVFMNTPTDSEGNPLTNIPIQLGVDFINLTDQDKPDAILKIEDVKVNIYPESALP